MSAVDRKKEVEARVSELFLFFNEKEGVLPTMELFAQLHGFGVRMQKVVREESAALASKAGNSGGSGGSAGGT